MSVFWSAADDRVELVAYRFAPPLHAWFCQRILHNGPWDCSSVYFQSAHYWAAARHFLVSPQKLELFWQFFLAVVLNLPRTTSVDVVWRRMFSALLVALSCNLCRACQRRSVSGEKKWVNVASSIWRLAENAGVSHFFSVRRVGAWTDSRHRTHLYVAMLSNLFVLSLTAQNVAMRVLEVEDCEIVVKTHATMRNLWNVACCFPLFCLLSVTLTSRISRIFYFDHVALYSGVRNASAFFLKIPSIRLSAA